MTGIKIEKYEDIEKFRKQLQFRIDKYNENFKDRKVSTDKQYLMSLVLGVISYLNISYNPDMTVVEFIEAKKRVEQLTSKQDGRN